MKRQCHCGDDADETVFGACRRCVPSPGQRTLPKLVPSWMFTVPEEPPWTTTLGPDEVCE